MFLSNYLKKSFLAVFSLSLFCLSWPLSAAPLSLVLCEAKNHESPYAHVQINPHTGASHVIGAVADAMAAIKELSGIDYSIVILPWEDCLLGLSPLDGILHSSANTQRLDQYYATTPLYRLPLGVFYNKNEYRFFSLHAISDLNGFRICGVAEHNYDAFMYAGLTAKVDMTVTDFPSAIKKLQKKQCDFVLSSVTSHLILPDSITYYLPHDLPQQNYHILIHKKHPQASEISARLNQAILTLHYNGHMEALFKKHTTMGTGL
jgi:ABC-type amino acid transport substrate-binding protein